MESTNAHDASDRLQVKESQRNTPAGKSFASMRSLVEFYDGKVYSVIDGPSQDEIRSLAHQARLQANGLAVKLDRASLFSAKVNLDITVGPSETTEIRTMSELQQRLAHEGKAYLLNQLGVVDDESLYSGTNPTRVVGGGYRNQIEDIIDQVGDIKGGIKPIVSRVINKDSRGAIGTLPGSGDITMLTWEGYAAVHLKLGNEALIKQAVQTRMPRAAPPL